LFQRLAQSARVIFIDRRGSGLSDALNGLSTIDTEVADIEAVLDALSVDRAAIFAYTSGGMAALAFGATRPERTLALVLYATLVRNTRDDEIDWTNSEEERARNFATMVAEWGTGMNLERLAPSAAGDPRLREWIARMERQSMTPSGLELVAASLATVDVREYLPTIRVPTLVLHRTDDQLIDVRHSRYLASKIAGARYVELPGSDSLPAYGDSEALLGEIEEFLTGGRRSGDLQRELLTVLFTDIVDATVHAARLGDARFRDLLTMHDRVVRDELARFGGNEVKTIGDSFLATFGGPPSQAVRCARSIVNAMAPLGLEVRCGLHTGECERMGTDVGGMAVHIAARVSALAGAGEVLASGTTFGTVVGSGIDFESRGDHVLKGVPGEWPLFVVSN
jgi:class 3 adenylate cyclase